MGIPRYSRKLGPGMEMFLDDYDDFSVTMDGFFDVFWGLVVERIMFGMGLKHQLLRDSTGQAPPAKAAGAGESSSSICLTRNEGCDILQQT